MVQIIPVILLIYFTKDNTRQSCLVFLAIFWSYIILYGTVLPLFVENVEQARFGIKVIMRMDISVWPNAWNVIQPLVAEAITSICNTNTWYTTCCKGSSLAGVRYITIVFLRNSNGKWTFCLNLLNPGKKVLLNV